MKLAYVSKMKMNVQKMDEDFFDRNLPDIDVFTCIVEAIQDYVALPVSSL